MLVYFLLPQLSSRRINACESQCRVLDRPCTLMACCSTFHFLDSGESVYVYFICTLQVYFYLGRGPPHRSFWHLIILVNRICVEMEVYQAVYMLLAAGTVQKLFSTRRSTNSTKVAYITNKVQHEAGSRLQQQLVKWLPSVVPDTHI